MANLRLPELEIYARIGVTKEAYDILRRWKLEQKKSMVNLVSNFIIKQNQNVDVRPTVDEAKGNEDQSNGLRETVQK